MVDFFKKGLYIGLGLASMTKDKVEELAKDMAKNAKLPEDEGRRLANELEEEAKKARETLKSNVDNLVEAAVSKLPCIKRMQALEARLACLEAKAGICTHAQELPLVFQVSIS